MLQARSWLPRTEGSLRLGFVASGTTTRLDTLHQSGAARARFPKPLPGSPPEAVLLNTAGGLTGGDRMSAAVTLGPDCTATIASAAAEKIYRSLDDPTEISINLELGERADCGWLPQPTILFNGSRLERRTTVHMAGTARLLAVEILLFGRTAMGEDVQRGSVRDAWRIHRDGRLIFADSTRVTGAIAAGTASSATMEGARATALLVHVAPHAAAQLDGVRQLLDAATDVAAGASSWNGMLVVRAAASTGRDLQRALLPIMVSLNGRPLPRVWQC